MGHFPGQSSFGIKTEVSIAVPETTLYVKSYMSKGSKREAAMIFE
jgi:hypothetical protein